MSYSGSSEKHQYVFQELSETSTCRYVVPPHSASSRRLSTPQRKRLHTARRVGSDANGTCRVIAPRADLRRHTTDLVPAHVEQVLEIAGPRSGARRPGAVSGESQPVRKAQTQTLRGDGPQRSDSLGYRRRHAKVAGKNGSCGNCSLLESEPNANQIGGLREPARRYTPCSRATR